jgi:uncharacterized membrane protein
MSAPLEIKPKSNWLPDTSRGFWRFCLLASLVVNLIVAGLVIGHFWHHGGKPGQQANFQQFVPGRFFAGLDATRRHELGDMLRGSKPEFDTLRQKNGELAAQVATELEKPDYDAAKVGTLIDSFTTGPDSMAAKGASVLKEFYGKLTADERVALAKSIRDRLARKGAN